MGTCVQVDDVVIPLLLATQPSSLVLSVNVDTSTDRVVRRSSHRYQCCRFVACGMSVVCRVSFVRDFVSFGTVVSRDS